MLQDPTKKEKEPTGGALSRLKMSAENKEKVLISCTHNKKLVGRLRAVDAHWNMVLDRVLEMWTESPKVGKGKKEGKKKGNKEGKKKGKKEGKEEGKEGKKKAEPVKRDRYIGKMFLRGDSVIFVLVNPQI
ncbi:Small nuclear ribonucleoprotein Sm D2 [Euphorbia peplus]|nr:Small nuclear ribonucleoprotein Sm D2 [Euphorbia peplus]